jgi:DNA-binding NarL/FixJ family response regulator
MQHHSPKPKLLLADEHTLVLDGLRTILCKEFDIAGTSGDGAQLIAQVHKLQPDVIISEIDLPNVSGLEVLALLRRDRADTKLIFVTTRADRTSLQHALREGANGYLLKKCSSWELEYAIREVLASRTYIAPQLKHLLEKKMSVSEDAALTPRECEVLRLVAEGQSARNIAANLRISAKTVVFHKTNLRQKLGVRNAAEMVTFAVRNGFLPASTTPLVGLRPTLVMRRSPASEAEVPQGRVKKEGT